MQTSDHGVAETEPAETRQPVRYTEAVGSRELRWYTRIYRAGGPRLTWLFILMVLTLLVLVGIALIPGDSDGDDDSSTPAADTAVAAETQGVADPAPEESEGPEQADTVGAPDDQADADGPLSGQWNVWWTNSEENTSVGFVIRFNGERSGTVDVLNDETETDTFFEVEGDTVTWGWQRANGSNGPDRFVATIVDEDTIKGTWYRPGCARQPGDCVLEIFEYDVELVRD